MKIFYATNNPGKLKEAQQIFTKFNVELVSPQDLNLAIDPEETGTTYEENARLKALAFRPLVPKHITVVGDDSGLEIPALNNEPGIHSRRWLDGKSAMTDQEILDYCLKRMAGLSGAQRNANFVGVLFAVDAKGHEFTAKASLQGRILDTPLQNTPSLPGYPFRSLFQELSTGKMLYELEDGEVPTHREKAFEQLFQSLNFR